MLTTVTPGHCGRRGVLLMIATASSLAGCASLPLPPSEIDSPAPSIEAAASAAAPEPVAPPPAPPRALPTARPRPAPAPRELRILFDGAIVESARVAAEIAAVVPASTFRVELADLNSGPSADASTHDDALTVAVGLEAVEAARATGDGPIVFCQVFNYSGFASPENRIWGVHWMPPPDLQLRSWKAIDPSLERVALIVSDAHAPLADETAAAGETIAVEVLHVVSTSDRETLYLFKRLAPEIDGLLLSPDNRILSPRVLRELLSYAAAHDVGVLVFNDALLPWGALLSVNSRPSDVARTVLSVLERVAAGTIRDLPAMTPLTEIDVKINDRTAVALGLVGSHVSWVRRELD